MAFLSRKADYALLILSYLHHHPGGGSAREIAERFDLSRPFVANILKELGHAGLVTSQRGANGGYGLAPGALAVSLDRLLEAIQEGFRLTVCSDQKADEHACNLESTCPVKTPLADIHRRIAAVLTGVTLQDLLMPLADPVGHAPAPHHPSAFPLPMVPTSPPA